MLPQIRSQEWLYRVPKFDITKEDVSNFMHELQGFHENFSDCFSRTESRAHFFRYMVGQFSELERKSIEPIAVAVEDGKVRALQRFVSTAIWDDGRIGVKYRSMVNEDLGDRDGVLIFDETGFPKKGEDSVGVAKQYCGNLGKVDNCQVGVFAGYASPHGYALVDKRLFIPERWFSEDYAERRKKCEMPAELAFRSKPQLAAQMLRNISQEDLLPFSYVLADSIYGSSPGFIDAVEQIDGVSYFVGINSDTRCWLTAPITVTKSYKYKGEIRHKTIVESTEKKPIAVGALAKSIHDVFWYRRTVSEGTKGPIAYEFTRRRVVLSKDGLPAKTVWLVLRRSLDKKNRTYWYFISNAPVSSRLPLFVWLSGLRWAIEQCFEETKTDLGLDHYEVRKYRGWHHHILTCMLAHFFLWHLKVRLGKKSTIHYSVAA
jgi:SRSO17 transposase